MRPRILQRRHCRIRQVTRAAIVSLLLVAGIGGCAEQFRADSTLHSDGRVDRTIYQPVQSTPEVVRQSKMWSRTSLGRQLQDEKWRTATLNELTPSDDQGGGGYLIAAGSFASADKIPPHFREPGGHPSKAAELLRNVDRNDWGLVTEHQWQETLTDVVSLADMRQARRELGLIVIEDAVEVLSLTLGEEYDLTALEAWARSDVLAWYEQLVDALYQVAARYQTDDERNLLLAQEFEEISARYGLVLRDASGRWLHEMGGGSGEMEQVVYRFVSGKLQELVRKKDGTPISEEKVADILEQIRAMDDAEVTPPIEQAAQELMVRKYGSEEAYQKKLAELATRVLGVHLLRLGQREFQFTMQVPGVIVETNGTLRNDSTVQWRFTHHQAFPFGYAMRCRSLEPKLEAQQRLLQQQPLTDRASMLRFVALLSGDARLHDAVTKSMSQGSLAPLRELQTALQSEAASQTHEDLAELLQLLKVDS